MADSKTGWWNPDPFRNSSKFHYVTATGRTLCGKWAYLGKGELEKGRDDHSDNCAGCRRKKLALNAATETAA